MGSVADTAGDVAFLADVSVHRQKQAGKPPQISLNQLSQSVGLSRVHAPAVNT